VTMTQLECLRATVAHEPHEGFLFYAGFTPDLRRRLCEAEGLGEDDDLRAHFGMFSPVGVNLSAPEGYEKPDFSHYFDGYDIPEGAFINGIGVLEIPHGFYHFTQYVSPLRNAERIEDLEAYPWPSVEGWGEDHMAAAVAEAHEAGRAAVCWIGHMYENAWQVRGYEPFLMDMMTRPEWCEYILDRFTEKNIVAARAGARAGADILRTGDDVANQKALMFAPEQWRRMIKARWARVYAAAREIKPDIEIWYHSDGNVEAVVAEMIEIGVTILNPVQPECIDLPQLKRDFGDQLVLDGTIGTQSTMPFGDPAEVRRVVRERAETLGHDGALILSPTHVLEPEVPVANIRAFVETAREFGDVR